MKKILVIFGTRPEAIKMAPIVALLQKHQDVEVKVCVTAQHRQMLDQVLSLFNIVPDYDLNLMKTDQDLTDITRGVLEGLKNVFVSWRPNLLLVHGDTTTTFSASLAGFYEKIPVAHVEAGLRTGDLHSPWPEEMNRRFTSMLSKWHFAPTNKARENLLAENILNNTIYVTGNTVVDALNDAVKKISDDVSLQSVFLNKFSFLDDTLKTILVTGHRRENFGEGFENLCMALKKLSERDDLQIVYPVHLNPNVQEPAYRLLQECKRVHLIEPQEYLPFVYLMDKSFFIITDSGGMQEEAPSLNKPVLVTRKTTERPEAVEAGSVKLVGTDVNSIISASETLLDDPIKYEQMASTKNPYGDGQAAKRIATILAEIYLGNEIGV
jgi:UDP-N-acetylglucosamine 2-epimerase (non-hydrolysing)